MIWIEFKTYYIIAVLFWLLALIILWFPKFNKSKKANIFSVIFSLLGGVTIVLFTYFLWIELDRPPMRTLGETRLWYSLFMPFIGVAIFIKWKYKWFLSYSLLMAVLFLTINLLSPETYSKTLMPALQSPWFVPHVVVYIFAYATLAASSLVAVKSLLFKSKYSETITLADNLVYIGFSFLSFGLIFGALWAKEAWGHYWTWDPKETWAFLTWAVYLIYIHFRINNATQSKTSLYILMVAFAVLIICWFGVNYLPTTNYSVHTYTKY
ncbi:MAG: cytochrome c biogenesis protein CcsA [Ichthyobacteriaceae bacterium]|nr:cytochrome c biogenesis protein CcsA [Ichthyobacteriaceae bacterium]